MEMNKIIKKPLLTEKSYKLMDMGVYTFIVNKHVNKIEVRNAIEFIFDVEVAKVNIIKVPKKAKKVGRHSGFIPGYKKAIVKLSKGEINFFPEEKTKKSIKTPRAEDNYENDNKQISAAEQRAADKIMLKQKEKEMLSKKTNSDNKQKSPLTINTSKKTNRGGDK